MDHTKEHTEEEALNQGYPPTASDRKLNELGYDLMSEHRQIIAQAGLDPSQPVLDVATGPGRMAFVLATAGYRVISGDISEEVMSEARQRLGGLFSDRIDFRLLDAARLNLPNASIKSAVIANAMHHMEEPTRVLEEIARILSPDGKAVIIEFNDKGFDVINQVHLAVHGNPHDRGKTSAQEIGKFLNTRFLHVQHRELPLNEFWIVSGKK